MKPICTSQEERQSLKKSLEISGFQRPWFSPSTYLQFDHSTGFFVKKLNWQEFLSLESEPLEQTVAKIVELAQEAFLERICLRFDLLYQKELLYRERWSELGSIELSFGQKKQLSMLTASMVGRLAQIHGLVSSTIARKTQALASSNVALFWKTMEEQSEEIYALYLGGSLCQESYCKLQETGRLSLEALENFMQESSKKQDPTIFLPVEEKPKLFPSFLEIRSMELITTQLVYSLSLALEAPKEPTQIKVELYIQEYGWLTYRLEEETDLWFGLKSYRFCCSSDPNAPEILSLRGFQCYREFSGFLASTISVWHPLGPGGNALTGSRGERFIEGIKKRGNKVILTGHSMGAEIALNLHKKIADLVHRTYTFQGPGCSKSPIDPHSPIERVYHFINPGDPVSYLGSFRDGRVSLICSHERAIPDTFCAMFRQATRIIHENHSSPQTLSKGAWMALSIKPGTPVGGIHPGWGLLYRLLARALYGSWKMVAMVGLAAIAFFQNRGYKTNSSLSKG